jgi:uncharacterized damage-inducible protein DinB
MEMNPEPWLRGPVPNVSPLLMPAAHALLQAREDLAAATIKLTQQELAARPGGAASVGFHLRHIAGSIHRLLSYAAGRPLTEAQFAELREEGDDLGMTDAGILLAHAKNAIGEALRVIVETPDEQLSVNRVVGRARLPTTVFGLLFHIAEHTQRHTGQIIATAKIVRHRPDDPPAPNRAA